MPETVPVLRVFLSHHSVDKPFVRQVAARLQADGVDFWLDEAELIPGRPWQPELEQAIVASNACTVFLGSSGLGPWQRLEIWSVISKLIEAQSGYRVIPVLLPGAHRPDESEIPCFLRQLTWVEFHGEPAKDDQAYHLLRCGIRNEKPGLFQPPAPAYLSVADRDALIVPRGLRAFEAEDHSWFLRLVPGPRDGLGLPTCLRFWKTQLEQTDADHTFRVGLLYGPSGCGKSSLVKAGLIPVLADFVLPIYVEATADDTEATLFRKLREKVSGLPAGGSLADALAHVGDHPDVLGGRKLVILLDQFEQWLQAHRRDTAGELIDALRRCDGRRLQAVLMVRDEFMLSVQRFFQSLDLAIREGLNWQTVDLFAPDHARTVLAEYGRAYDRLPRRCDEPLAKDQQVFLSEAIRGLEQRSADGKIVSIHVTLLAQMTGDDPWTPATLGIAGGAAGVGVAFLNKNFDRRTANPDHQVHRTAAAAVLKCLLPESGTNIRGHSQTTTELLAAAGYVDRPTDFRRLMEILDDDLRIITPTERHAPDDRSLVSDCESRYQLTHDYLVPSVRDWLNANLQKTWRGRAQRRLEERTMQWQQTKNRRFLPGPFEFVNILAGVPWTRYQPSQRAMLRAAAWQFVYFTAFFLLGPLCVFLWYNRLSGTPDLAERLRLVPPDKFRQVWKQELRDRREQLIPELRDLMNASPHEQLVKNGQLRADAAIVLWFDNPQKAVQVMRVAGDPEPLTQFVNRCRPRGVPPFELWKQLVKARTTMVRYRLILALGEYDSDEISDAERAEWVDLLGQWYRSDPSSAVHSASGWLLRHWGETNRVKAVDRTPVPYDSNREWFVQEVKYPDGDAEYFTLIVFPPGEFQMGSSANEPNHSVEETQHTVCLTGRFAVCDREITQGQFARIRWKERENESALSHPDDHPAFGVSWQIAVEYCRWLTTQAKLEQCYFATADVDRRRVEDDRDEETRADLPTTASCLLRGEPSREYEFHPELHGFRLLTEAEWEYACRAGATTRFSFGNDESLLAKYAQVAPEGVPTVACGALRPNPRGLFDMHGNVWEFCADWFAEYPTKLTIDPRGPDEGFSRVLRGGSRINDAGNARSACRNHLPPTLSYGVAGFRVARSVP